MSGIAAMVIIVQAICIVVLAAENRRLQRKYVTPRLGDQE